MFETNRNVWIGERQTSDRRSADRQKLILRVGLLELDEANSQRYEAWR